MTLSPTEAALLSAIIGASAALAVVLIRDVVIEGHRDKTRRRRDLIDRRLSEIYGPLWIAFGGENGVLSNILASEATLSRLGANFHLLSPELRDLLERNLLLVTKNGEGYEISLSASKSLVKISPQFKAQLKRDMQELQRAYLNG